MRKLIIEKTVYKFEELSEKAQQKALDKIFEFHLNYAWWDRVYEDAENVGVKIKAFDIDRGNYIKGEITYPETVANNVLKEHGKTCETYKVAESYLKARKDFIEKNQDEDGEISREAEYSLEDMDKEFKREILEQYLSMLKKEYEYLTSKEAILETIEANQYEFDENGGLA